MGVDREQQAEMERFHQESRFLHSLMEHFPDRIYYKDLESRFITGSQSFLRMCNLNDVSDLKGLTDFDLFTEEHARAAFEDEQEIIRTGQSKLNLEEMETWSDGRVTWCSTSKAPFRDEQGRIIGTFGISRDITEQKAAERERQAMEVQLRHAQKLESIGSMAAGIAHEINTPIQYIGDNTSFLGGTLPTLLARMDALRRYLLDLQARQALPAPGAELLDQIAALDLDYLAKEIPLAIRQTQDGVSRVAVIVNAMKDFSHPGGEGKILADLNKAIESTLTVSRNEWKYLAKLETDLDPALPAVPCLLGEFNQVLLNLVVNAAHAIEEALGGRNTGALGTIKVSTHQVGHEVRISISDTGKGIPENIRGRIFEPFFTTKPVGKGTGQGLAIAHAVLEKHGGRITVESEVGRGTCFHLFLPLGTQDLGQTESLKAQHGSQGVDAGIPGTLPRDFK
jgi:PAS domain S-box-containing protein